MLIRLFILLIGCSLSPIAFAIFCPNNFNSINIGDTVQTVMQTCGAPASQSNYIKPIFLSQAWIYYVNPTFGINQGSNKLRVVFNNDQVVNLTITENVRVCQPLLQSNGYSVTNTNTSGRCNNPVISQQTRSIPNSNACGGYISLGNTMAQVEAACGKPVSTNHSQQPDSQKNITEFLYNGPPVTKLIFVDGVLTDRVQQ